MSSFYGSMKEFRKLLEEGTVQVAYQGLMSYFMDLKTYFKNKYPDHFVSGSIYYGYMDMTYFSFMPGSIKDRKLKVAIVFVFDTFRFEVWLGGYNKKVQSEYWKLFRESGWDKYPIVETLEGMDSIVEHTLVDDPDFSDLDALTKKIDTGTIKFIQDIESFLSEH